MRIKAICLLLSLLLLLGGCSAKETASAITGLLPPPTTATAPTQPVAKPQTLPALLPGTKPPAAEPVSGAVQELINDAGEEVFFAVLSNPDSARYRAMGQPQREVEAVFAGDIMPNTVLLVPLQDGVRIVVEEMIYNPYLSWAEGAQVFAEFAGKVGEHYALTAVLREGVPNVRVRVEKDGKTAVWMCTYDGRGDRDVDYLQSEAEAMLFEEFTMARGLSGVAAGAAVSMADWDEAFWVAIAAAITQTSDSDCVTYENDKIILSEERFFQYIEALFPRMTMWPELPDSITRRDTDNTYAVTPYYDNSGDVAWEMIGGEYYDDSGMITIEVTCPRVDAFPITVKVLWEANADRGENDPFAYRIVEIAIVEAMG